MPKPTTDPSRPPSPADMPGSLHGVRYRWLGDTGRFYDGVPSRDVTADDTYLSDELCDAAVAAGTHEKVS